VPVLAVRAHRRREDGVVSKSFSACTNITGTRAAYAAAIIGCRSGGDLRHAIAAPAKSTAA
jgi:hypothetical protein